jgi:hypothetical protein
MDLASELKKRRRELILGGALLVVAVVYFTKGGESPGGAAQETLMVTEPPASVAKAMAKISSVKIPGVLLERLSDERVPYDPTQRNIFRFGNLPPSPEELARIEAAKQAAEQARQAAIQAELDAQKNAAAAAAAAAEAARNQPPIDPATGLPVGMVPPPPPKPMPPAVTLRYSGYLGSERDKMAVLYSGEDMLLARSGDVVEKQFKILDIGYDWVKIGYVDPQFADQYQKLRMGP